MPKSQQKPLVPGSGGSEKQPAPVLSRQVEANPQPLCGKDLDGPLGPLDDRYHVRISHPVLQAEPFRLHCPFETIEIDMQQKLLTDGTAVLAHQDEGGADEGLRRAPAAANPLRQDGFTRSERAL